MYSFVPVSGLTRSDRAQLGSNVMRSRHPHLRGSGHHPQRRFFAAINRSLAIYGEALVPPARENFR